MEEMLLESDVVVAQSTAADEAKRTKRRAYNRAYYIANRKKAADYYIENREKKRAYNAEWFKANREKALAYGAAWYAANREKVLANRAKNRGQTLLTSARLRARKKGLKCTITQRWVDVRLARGVCEATGLRFDLNKIAGRPTARSPSIDRIDPRKGYTPRNAMLVCWHYNVAKHEYGVEELLILATAIVTKHGLVKPAQ